MSDLEALYRAVLARPEEDTPRLMYADAVEERGDPARAELIRAQCEYASLDRVDRQCPHSHDYADSPCRWQEGKCQCRGCELVRIEQTLRSTNRERWEPACVACGGRKTHAYQFPRALVTGEDLIPCPACKGTGRQPCRWERGFPVVEVAEMRQAWHDVGKTRPDLQSEFVTIWEPTLWLRDTLRTHHVAGVLPMHLEPGPMGYRQYVWAHGDAPDPVFKHCDGIYASSDEARDALARAVVVAALEWLDTQGAGS